MAPRAGLEPATRPGRPIIRCERWQHLALLKVPLCGAEGTLMAEEPTVFSFGDFELDEGRRELRRAGTPGGISHLVGLQRCVTLSTWAR